MNWEFIAVEKSMPLSKRKLGTYQKYYDVKLEQIREFDNGNTHPVVLFREFHTDKKRGMNSWMNLICPCDLAWKWRTYHKKRELVHTGDGFNCPAKEYAREIAREEWRKHYQRVWADMSLADVVLHIYRMYFAGHYVGEHTPGVLYVQDVEALLGTKPDAVFVCFGKRKDAKGDTIGSSETTKISFPNRTILDAVNELKRRKLVDLNGMILIPYKESFRFPETLHHQFAYWIEEPLGWPNGDAGDCFMFELYKKIAKTTGWAKGEDVFGEENLPDLALDWKKRFVECWLSLLHASLSQKDTENKGEILTSATISEWIAWLNMIREEIHGTKKTV